MENTRNLRSESQSLLQRARQNMAEDMRARQIAAIIWDNSTAGFHFIPEVTVRTSETSSEIIRIEGLYLHDGSLYLIEEGEAPVGIDDLYNPDTEVRPTVVTLTAELAARHLGDPSKSKGFTREGSIEEWLTVADCYFEALAE